MRSHLRGWLLAVAFTVYCGGCDGAVSAPGEIVISDAQAFPESMTSTSDGTLIIGSMASGTIFRAPLGAASAEPWIKPGANGLQRVLGVLADEGSGTLWVCSAKRPQGPPTALKTFDLRTGSAKGSFDFPNSNSLCNDIAVGPDGTAYATDTTNASIMRLVPGAKALEVWAKDDRMAVVDGIAFGDEHTIYVNTFSTGHLLRVPLNPNGTAGAIVVVSLSQPLTQPDGMRPIGRNEFLLVEGAGRLDHISVKGDVAEVKVIREGFDSPTGTTLTRDTVWVVEGKLRYLNDPKLRGNDPGPFKAYPLTLQR